MKTIMITGPNSDAGKTIVSVGLIRALKNRGMNIAAFKTGPDMIDRDYLTQAAGKKAGNLDGYLMGYKGIEQALTMFQGEFAVVEGVMGYFDGVHNSFRHSNYELSQQLNLPAILVYSPVGELFTAIPKIKGMIDFPDSQIKGLILNQVSPKMYELLKEQIESYSDIELLGYLPIIESVELEGTLDQQARTLEKIAEQTEKTIDLAKVIELAESLDLVEKSYPSKRDLKIAVAHDKAFQHYYNENLFLLEKVSTVSYFSPLHDESLPDCDLIYISGKAIEKDYIQDLAKNEVMKKAIRQAAKAGQTIIAENAGLLYLLSAVDDYPMIGLFQGTAQLSQRLNLKRFGYVDIKLTANSLWGKKGELLRGNESHRSTATIQEEAIFQVRKAKTDYQWSGGYRYKNTLAYYQHLHFLGNPLAFSNLLDQIEQSKAVKP